MYWARMFRMNRLRIEFDCFIYDARADRTVENAGRWRRIYLVRRYIVSPRSCSRGGELWFHYLATKDLYKYDIILYTYLDIYGFHIYIGMYTIGMYFSICFLFEFFFFFLLPILFSMYIRYKRVHKLFMTYQFQLAGAACI